MHYLKSVIARRVESTKHKSEGVVLVFAAMFMFVLMIFLAFAVDVGFWYLQADKIQRASDSAALSGAAAMPDTEKAIADATATLGKNGFAGNGSTRSVNVIPIEPNRVRVELSDTNVQTFFARFIFDRVPIKRSSEAQFRRSLPLGSPHNVLGTGWLDIDDPSFQGRFWLAVNGWCTAKEDGDPLSSQFDGNKRATSTLCPANKGSAASQGIEVNEDYDPTGYDFIATVPAGSPAVVLSAYDAGFAAGSCPGVAPLGCSPDNTAGRADDAPAHITTTFTLFDTNGTDGRADDDLVPGANFTFDSASLPACAVAAWCGLATLPANNSGEPRAYRLNVRTLQGQQQSWGVNAFALAAGPVGADPLKSFCDIRETLSCPQVFASKALSIFTNFSATDRTVRFYLADVDEEAEGEVLTVGLFDPGEGAQAIGLRQPDETKALFRFDAIPNDSANKLQSASTDYVQTSGTGEQPGPGRTGTNVFNDRLVELKTIVAEGHRAPDNSGWWSIEYIITPGVTPQDRTTWNVKIADDRPVQLVRSDDD